MAKSIKTAEPAEPAAKAARRAKPVADAVPAAPVKRAAGDKLFSIVGIGASAGGLEALAQFLEHVPADSGMAFVIIQHLDPTHKGMMPELLQRNTRMAVHQARNRMRVKPNCVYVIPPNKDLSILHGVLYLLETVAPRGLRLPIDFFFRALAEDRREQSIGVILSGMGSDGALGLRAIKEKAGLALVQEPSTAKFDGMPRSAIDAGLADIIAPPEMLPEHIVAYLRHAYLPARFEVPLEHKTRSVLEKVVILLRERTGNDFSQYKKNTLYRRIERRMAIHQVDSIANYARFLRGNAQELDLLFKELLIGVTSFFRDPLVWESLVSEALPLIMAAYPAGKALRAWVPACSTGEEAFSLAMAFKEALERVMPHGRFSLQIFATDLDQDAIDRARQGIYPANIVADVSPERLSRFFIEEDAGYRVNKEIREMVVFAPQNIIMDPPFTKLDILSCRNLLIYLGPELQKKLIPLFHYALNPGGLLMLGTSETIGAYTALFTLLDSKTRLYRRVDTPMQAVGVEFPTKTFPAMPSFPEERQAVKPAVNLQLQADQLLLQKFSPAAVLVNSAGDIVYISGRTGKYLEPAAGKADWNIHAMARDGLRHELTIALRKVARQHGSITLEGLKVAASDGQVQNVNLVVHAIEVPEALQGMVMVVFIDVPPPAKAGRRSSNEADKVVLEELRLAREEIQSLHEEMQSSQEELTSTNEELQSTNEELQSTNEELTTSKEELQSLNEELQTVNAELQSKVDDLSWVNSDMKNLLDSTGIATVFLDGNMHVRRFTAKTTGIFKLIPGDVGRPLSDIVMDLQYPEMMADAQEVLRTLVFSEKDVAGHDGRWFKVRIMPYRTLENVIDGVVITFTDITAAKKLEVELREKIRAAGLGGK